MVPALGLKTTPLFFCRDNKWPNCTLFQVGTQKAFQHSLLWRWLLRSSHTFLHRGEVSTQHVCLLCILLRTFHPQVTEYNLCFFAFLNTWLQRHHFREEDPNLEHEKKLMVGNANSLIPLLTFLELLGLLDSNERCLAEGCSSKDTLFALFFVLLFFLANSANFLADSANWFKHTCCCFCSV